MSKKSDKKKKNDIEDIVENEEVELDAEALQEMVTALREENEALVLEVEKHKNEYFKAYADAENVRKRIERDHELSMKYRIQTFAHSILPALDNLERALSQEANEESKQYRDGVKMIYDQIMTALHKEGVDPIEALGKEFDPNIHQALMLEEKEGVEPNVVIEELQKGYMIKDRVLRASLVKVSQ